VNALPVPSALARRDRLWPALAGSVLVHLVLVTWGLARRQPPAIDLQQKPIVAKLVRLGEKRPEQWLPRHEAGAPPPAAPAAPPAPVPVAAAARPAAPAPKAPPRAAPKPAAAPAAPAPPGPSLSSILSKVQRQSAEDRRWGDPGGDAAGDSDTADGDQYLALVDRALRSNYVAPVTIPERERLYLEASVVLWIEPDGRVARYHQEKSSGNPAFDAAVDRTLKLTPRVPPPPERLRDALRRSGITLVFQARQT
jgi:colicin import membrane protein/protein TonB